MTSRRSISLQVLLAMLLIISVSSCDPSKKYKKDETASIQTYLSNNSSLSFEQQTSGLYYHEVLAGTGRQPVLHDTAYVFYTGKFLNGSVFDTNVGTTDTLIFPVAEGWMIPGFDEGVTLIKAGGKGLLLVPSNLGYGAGGAYGVIPGYTALLYEVQIIKVKPGPITN